MIFLRVLFNHFLLARANIKLQKKWLTEEWGLGDDGYFEYYSNDLGISDRPTILHFREMINQNEEKGISFVHAEAANGYEIVIEKKFNNYMEKINTTLSNMDG